MSSFSGPFTWSWNQLLSDHFKSLRQTKIYRTGGYGYSTVGRDVAAMRSPSIVVVTECHVCGCYLFLARAVELTLQGLTGEMHQILRELTKIHYYQQLIRPRMLDYVSAGVARRGRCPRQLLRPATRARWSALGGLVPLWECGGGLHLQGLSDRWRGLKELLIVLHGRRIWALPPKKGHDAAADATKRKEIVGSRCRPRRSALAGPAFTPRPPPLAWLESKNRHLLQHNPMPPPGEHLHQRGFPSATSNASTRPAPHNSYFGCSRCTKLIFNRARSLPPCAAAAVAATGHPRQLQLQLQGPTLALHPAWRRPGWETRRRARLRSSR
jgi:hypothetical protein